MGGVGLHWDFCGGAYWVAPRRPNQAKCPGWALYAENGSATPAWILAGMFTGLPTIWICYVVLRWEQKSQEIYGSIAYGRPKLPFSFLYERHEPLPKELNFENIFLVNFNWLFLLTCIMWCLFCAAPLLMMVTECTNALRYLGY
jgi:hypothetical protein